jgi:hypothetical protein
MDEALDLLATLLRGPVVVSAAFLHGRVLLVLFGGHPNLQNTSL